MALSKVSKFRRARNESKVLTLIAGRCVAANVVFYSSVNLSVHLIIRCGTHRQVFSVFNEMVL